MDNNNVLKNNMCWDERYKQCLTELRDNDSIELYKMMYEKYKPISDYLNSKTSLDVFYRDIIQNSFLGGLYGATLGYCLSDKQNYNIVLTIVGFLIGYSFGCIEPVYRNINDLRKIGNIQKELIEIAKNLKILEDKNRRYYIYQNEEDKMEKAKNSCIPTEPALHAVYKIVCKRKNI